MGAHCSRAGAAPDKYRMENGELMNDTKQHLTSNVQPSSNDTTVEGEERWLNEGEKRRSATRLERVKLAGGSAETAQGGEGAHRGATTSWRGSGGTPVGPVARGVPIRSRRGERLSLAEGTGHLLVYHFMFSGPTTRRGVRPALRSATASTGSRFIWPTRWRLARAAGEDQACEIVDVSWGHLVLSAATSTSTSTSRSRGATARGTSDTITSAAATQWT